METSPTILVASCSVDRPTWEPVVSELLRCKQDVFVFEADKVALQETPFSVKIDEQRMSVTYDNKELCLDGLAAAWFRRPSFITNPQSDGAVQMSLDMERRLLQAGIWNEIPDDIWLNSPEQIRRAEGKVTQLIRAQNLGFNIPKTVISNTWPELQQELPDDVICKSAYSIFYDGTGYIPLYTTRFTNSADELPLQLNPFPGIWQPSLNKAREWRITAIGDETFDAAIYTSEDAKDDWRKYQLIPGNVEFRKETFPDNLKEKCIEYLGSTGLRFGCFDFIEDQDGVVTFLECNPNGQFMWLQAALGLPISNAIASELIKITMGS